MSRQNKVNRDRYTQRGRLTPDDAAREIARQRSVGSQRVWQPVKRNARPRLPFKNENADRNAQTSEETERTAASPSRGKARPAERTTGGTSTKSTALAKAKRSNTRKTSKVKQTSDVGRVPRLVRRSLGKGGSGLGATNVAKTARAAKRAKKTTATGTTRKAVLARNVGGPALKPLRAGKRRKS
jgi:hypothetical protein